MKITRFAGPILVASIFLAGCQMDEEIVNCVEEGPPVDAITVSATCGDNPTSPVFSWSDGGMNLVTKVTVTTTDVTPTTVWDISSKSITTDDIATPLVYGTVPVTANQGIAPTPLTVGVWYRVTVHKLSPVSTGNREFRIKP